MIHLFKISPRRGAPDKVQRSRSAARAPAALILSMAFLFAAIPALAQEAGAKPGRDAPETISAQEGEATVSPDEMRDDEGESDKARLGSPAPDASEPLSSAVTDPLADAGEQMPEPPAAEAYEALSPEAPPADMPPADTTAAPETPNGAAPKGVTSDVRKRTAPRYYGPVVQPVVVVELFTAQGCSSCPPADALLADLADDRDILALAFHVDYWDYLGWVDPFARPEFTQRQKAYARAAQEHSLYTPQIIVGGTDTLISARPADLTGLIAQNLSRPPVVTATHHQKGEMLITELAPIGKGAGRSVVLLVRYVPRRAVHVTAGENRGRHMVYRNVVVGIEQLASWDGQSPMRLTIQARGAAPSNAYPPDTRHALVVQQIKPGGSKLPGRILTALRLD